MLKTKIKHAFTLNPEISEALKMISKESGKKLSQIVNEILSESESEEIKKKISETNAEQNIEKIAELVHEAHRIYKKSIKDDNEYKEWNKAPKSQREAGKKLVRLVMMNPGLTPENHHENWQKERKKEGWRKGKRKNMKKKEHPNIDVEYKNLKREEQTKAELAITLIKFMLRDK